MAIKSSAVARRGRPSIDLALRVRNIGWYWLIKAETKKSDEALDKMFVRSVSKEQQPRVFFRIRAVGSSPAELRGYRGRLSLYDTVHAEGAYPRAKAWYSSCLWEVLTHPRWAAADYSQFIDREARARNWLRPDAALFELGQAAFGEGAFSDGGARAYNAMLQHLGGYPTLNNIGLLCALFREAHAAFALDRAEDVRACILLGLTQHLRTCPLPDVIARCFDRLIRDRVLNNVWLDETDMPSRSAGKRGTRQRQIKEGLAWYASGLSNSNSAPPLPILRMSDRVKWLVDNRDGLLKRFPPIDAQTYLARVDALLDKAEMEPTSFDQAAFVDITQRFIALRSAHATAEKKRRDKLRTAIKETGLRTSDKCTLLEANPRSEFTWLKEQDEPPDAEPSSTTKSLGD